MGKKTNRGGRRENAGRKKKYGEPTTTIAFRVPLSIVDEIKEYVKKRLQEIELYNLYTKKDET